MTQPPRLVDAPCIRWLFAVAAIWNISAAVMALALPDFHAASFFGPELSIDGPIARMNTQAFWVSVLLFGVGYAIVARDPSKNHGLVLLAAIGKTYVFALWTVAWAQSVATPLALAGALGDLAFAAVFVWFLLRARGQAGVSRTGQTHGPTRR